MEKKSRGQFITFEGPEGSGKSTQINLVYEELKRRNIDCIITREPGGTPLAEKLREIIKYHPVSEPIFDETELLLLSASRAQHVRMVIMPALNDGKVVLCDRFCDSTLAYQCFGRGLDLDFTQQINSFATCGISPDLTILLDLSPEDSQKRLAARAQKRHEEDRIEALPPDFFHRVRDGFLVIAEHSLQRVKKFDAAMPVDQLQQMIFTEIENNVISKISR